MNREQVREYIGKKVLLILRNNYRYTAIIPDFNDECFSIRDKYNKPATISCNMIDLISEVRE